MKIRTWRKIHRYMGLVIGVQFLLWTASGMIFSWNSIKDVRGEHLVLESENVNFNDFQIKAIDEILEDSKGRFDDSICVTATLRTMLDRPVYELALKKEDSPSFVLYDAESGQSVSPIGKETAKAIALADFSEIAEVQSIELMKSASSHSEYRGKELPAYRVVLDHSSGTVIYVSANRGVVTSRRNNRWRLFDFFWMLHTMDYQGRDNFNTWVLKGVSAFGLFTVLSGFVLWFKTSRFSRKRRPKRGITSSARQNPER